MKKSRSSKRAKSVKGDFFYEPVTGARVSSDKVYVAEGGIGRSTYEWEFGADTIVGTVISEPAGDYPSDNIQRFVLKGDFKYATGSGDISGRIDYIVQGDYFPGVDDEAVVVSRVNGENVFRNYRESFLILGQASGVDRPFFYANASPEGVAANAAVGINIVTDKSGLAQYGASSFFAGQWWSAPFAANLV